MVKYRSEHSRSRTGIHGGIRRGSAAAAIGAVLVLTAGVPASQAEGTSGSEEPDVQVSGGVQLPGVGGLLDGLLGAPTTTPTSPQPTPVPETTTVSPSPVPATTVPNSPAPPPTTTQQPHATSAAVTGAAKPLPAASPLVPTATAAAMQQPAAAAAAASEVTGGSGAEIPAVRQTAAKDTAAPSAVALLTGRAGGTTATSRTGIPQAVGGAAESGQQMTAQTEPAAEAAKVWIGVGLVGSAGAAGLVFTRIRRF